MSANNGNPLVRVRALEKSFGANQVLKGVDLDVPKGDVVAIIGASGSGKTTLLRCVNLLETYDAGSIEVDGVEVDAFQHLVAAEGFCEPTHPHQRGGAIPGHRRSAPPGAG